MASMTIFSLYKIYKDRWWALPLILPIVLLPVARLATTYAQINGNPVVLY